MSSLALTIDKDSPTPMWVQIRDQIRLMVQNGTLEPEQKLPPVRTLAADLDVSVSVVNQAYRYLRLVGYLEARQGSGVRVRRRRDAVAEEDSVEIGRLIGEFVDRCVEYGIPREDVPDSVSYFLAHHELDSQADPYYLSKEAEKRDGAQPRT